MHDPSEACLYYTNDVAAMALSEFWQLLFSPQITEPESVPPE